MYLYSKHLVTRTFIYSIIFTIALTSILWITQSVRVMDLIVNKGIRIVDFVKISVYLLPSLIFIILPISTLGATIAALGRANHDKEITIMKSIGLSTFQIAKPFIYNAVLMTIIGYAFSFYLLPKSYQEFKNLQSFLRNNYASMLLEEGTFSDKINNLTLYVERREKDNSFSNIFVHNTKKPGKAITIIAQKGKLENDDNSPKLVVQNGIHQEQNLQKGNITMMTFDHYTVDISSLQDYLESKRILEPTERFIHELFDVKDNIVNKNRFISNAHQRIVWPLFCLTLSVFASFVIVTRNYSRNTSSWKKNIPLLFVSACVLSISVVLQNLSLKEIRIAWLMYVNAAIPLLISAYIINKAKCITKS